MSANSLLAGELESLMLMIVLGALGALTLTSIYITKTGDTYERRNSRNPAKVMAGPVSVISGILFLVGGIIYPISYATSTSSNAQLVAYSDTVHAAYIETFKQTAAIKTGAGSLAAVSLLGFGLDSASWEQNKVIAARLEELRDAISRYNGLLQAKLAWNNNWFLRMWIAPVPAGLKPIQFPQL